MKKMLLPLLCCLALLFAGPVLAQDELKGISQPKLAEMINNNAGKVIMLNFFATWCPPCKVEIPQLVKLRNFFPADQLEIIGLSVDEEKKLVPGFLKQLDVNYPVYMAGGDITGSYDISSVPHNVFYAPGGQMVISEPGLADIDLLKQIVTDLLAKSVKAR